MSTPATSQRRWGALIFAALCLALAIAVYLVIPPPINTGHISVDQPVPGQVTLPATVTPAP